jgi:Na+/H+ antiporter NhaD/arsenite permease-like protein
MNISVSVLLLVFILIAIRQVGKVRFEIWQIMTGGAVLVTLTGQISFLDAMKAIDIDVMLFLFGMFVVGDALEESGYLAHISYKYFKRAKTMDGLILSVLFGAGITSAILMNDTLAVVGTPVAMLLARKHGMPPQLLLLTLAFAITIGSVMSPIGNPQNLLIAIHAEIKNPFVTFLTWLCIPTLLNLLVAFIVLKHFYHPHFHETTLSHSQEPIRNHDLALLAKISLHLTLVLIAVKILDAAFQFGVNIRLTAIALLAALPILIASRQRLHILKRIDWHSLVFFAAMFVLMESVWQSGFFQRVLSDMRLQLTSLPVILALSTGMSQFISNVPLVALFQPLLLHAGASTKELMALAAGSTIAGNLFILGAASNVIIIQRAEKKSKQTITFVEFAKVGGFLTFVNLLIYWLWIEALASMLGA